MINFVNKQSEELIRLKREGTELLTMVATTVTTPKKMPPVNRTETILNLENQ